VMGPAFVIFIGEIVAIFVFAIIVVPFVAPCIVPIVIPVVVPIEIFYVDIGMPIPIMSIVTDPISIPPHKTRHEESKVNTSILSLICVSNISLLGLGIIRENLLAHIPIPIDNYRIDLTGSGCDICSPLNMDNISIQIHRNEQEEERGKFF
jgi:hypothetical protein